MTARPATLLASSLVLALLASLLFAGAAWGLNVGVWATILLLASIRLGARVANEGRALAAGAVGFAWLFALRDSDALKLANGLALAFCLGGLVVSDAGASLRESSVGRWLAVPFTGLAALASGAWGLGRRVRSEREVSPEADRKGRAVARSLLLAAPLLLVFGALFAGADAVFRNGVEGLGRFDIDLGSANANLWSFGLAFLLAAGLFHRLVLASPALFPERPEKAGAVGIIEVGIVLGSLVLLFGAFLAVQFRTTFGDRAIVGSAGGQTYAEYARGGFFELLWVAALTLVVLVGADRLLRRDGHADERAFRLLGRLLVGLVLQVVASALNRMRLYTDAFGLTELRVYSTVFMVWLALGLAWALATVLSGRPRRLASGMLAAALGVIAGTNLLDPDGLMVRTNLSKPNADFAYLESLGDDAALALRARWAEVPAARRAEAARWIHARRVAAQEGDRRELNLARWLLSR